MLSSTFLNGTAECPVVLFGFSIGSINNLASFLNASGILLTVGRYLTFISHTYEQNPHKLYVYLFWDKFLASFIDLPGSIVCFQLIFYRQNFLFAGWRNECEPNFFIVLNHQLFSIRFLLKSRT